MHDYLISLLLGIVEGVTEFLPVSSTAHLRLTESWLHLPMEDGYWKTYSIVIQLGAILCLPAYFRHRIIAFIRSFMGAANKWRHPLTLTALAFVVTAIPSYFAVKLIGANLESMTIIGWALVIGGVVMGAVDLQKSKWEKAGETAPHSPIRTWRMEDMTPVQAVVIGLCQVAAAVFPGTSRSMATIAGGQLMGLSRAAALEFSFFLSMPTMAAATGFVMLKSIIGDADDNPFAVNAFSMHEWIVLAIGFVVSFIIAYASVAFLMKWVRTHGFIPFAVYRILFGGAVLWLMT